MLDHGEDPRPDRGAVREIYTPERAATLEYSPDMDGLADPGEIVWAWVPYEEDPERGKDRPLLVVGRHGRRLLAMMLSSKAHDSEDWLDLGTGAWDRDGRESYLRLDRVFALDEDDIRREGSVLDPERFAHVAAALMRAHGWKPTRARS
ncbi:type II toxin-antitoxin system PemK/MazF family toxin [Actinomadura sp. DC4]|uniref:type II toxin-antitoxin system PemK/MazF family toxin n=1 Tax=Actinomadura sp. DC4 TaxID=3055069 RepID=UPI0025B264EB|nr:type II toxin-antitoxin system PemK/MazF family toxin [Actinomadura sp. DC4]MDN3352072.1 type II toxin-antitoxin system PemK/MazF family toxin [Actinomadura sp. DC4]